MNLVLIGLLILVAALLGWIALEGSRREQRGDSTDSQLAELRRELQTLAAAQAQNAGQIAAIGQSVGQRLESVTKALQEGVTNSAQIAAGAQTAMAGELKNTREQIGEIQKQLGAVQQAGQQMSQTVRTLESILGGAKSRGSLGEVTLENLLADSLPPSQYSMQYRFASGEAADAVIFLRDKKLLAVDSKFPLDAFRRIATEGDDARKGFASAVKLQADAIAKKYIRPAENTLDLALMFVPSESVYYELLMTADGKGQPLDAYCRERRVIPVSPNTLYAHLCVIAMGLRGMQIEENARRLGAGLSGLQNQLGIFTEVFEKLGTHLKNVQQSYGDADKRLEKTHNTLDNLLSNTTPESLPDAAETSAAAPRISGEPKHGVPQADPSLARRAGQQSFFLTGSDQ
jgi:DNA recombination protein RmuC